MRSCQWQASREVDTLAARRQYSGYGSQQPKMPQQASSVPVPPPPDGKPPVRLPVGVEPVPAEMDPMEALLMRLRNGEA